MFDDVKRFIWTASAIVFLAISWVWDALAQAIKAVLDVIPPHRLKAFANRLLDRLPPYPTLLVFAIPLGLSELVKVASYVVFAHKDVVIGGALFIAAEIVRYGLAAYVWTLCREKLLSIAWVAKLHAWLVRLHHWASAQTAPVKARIRKVLVNAGLVGGDAGIWLRIRALGRHARRKTT